VLKREVGLCVSGFRHTPRCRLFRYVRIFWDDDDTTSGVVRLLLHTPRRPRGGGAGCSEHKYLLCISDWISLF
jgi:hypothetical protein